MFIKQFLTGGDRNFGYLIADESANSAAIIDPSYSPTVIADFANEKGYNIEYVFNTHGDPDHTMGIGGIDVGPRIRTGEIADGDAVVTSGCN